MRLVSVPILMPGSPLFEKLLDLADRPFLRCGNHANPSVVSHRDERMRADLLLNLFDTDVSLRPPMQGDIKVAGKDLPLRTIVQLNQVTFGMRPDFHSAACFSSCFKRVRPDTTSLFSSVSLGARDDLTFGDLPEDEIAKCLASLTKLAMIAILELLEHAHGALNSGRRDDFFDRIGRGRNNYGG
jgi:hypothetical protein